MLENINYDKVPDIKKVREGLERIVRVASSGRVCADFDINGCLRYRDTETGQFVSKEDYVEAILTPHAN